MSPAVKKRRNFGTGAERRPWHRGEAAAAMSTAVATLALAWLQPFGRCEAAAAVNGTLYGAVGPPPFVRPAWMDVGGNATSSVGRVDVCALNACEAYVRMRDDLANAVRPINEKLRGGEDGGRGGVAGDRGALLEARLQRLDRRLRSVEQPGEYIIIFYHPMRIPISPCSTYVNRLLLFQNVKRRSPTKTCHYLYSSRRIG